MTTPQRQPRIKGIKRNQTVSALHPVIREVIEEIAHKEKKAVSYVIAGFLGKIAGFAAETGDKINGHKRAVSTKRRRMARRKAR